MAVEAVGVVDAKELFFMLNDHSEILGNIYQTNKIMNLYRYFLKDYIRKEIDFSLTHQNKGYPVPAIEKPYNTDAKKISLAKPDEFESISKIDLLTAIKNRKSHRVFKNKPLTINEVSYLLWCTQGIRSGVHSGHAYRNVPSAGARHSFETYLVILNVEMSENNKLMPGIYRYLPLTHELLFEFTEDNLEINIVKAVLGQPYPGKAALTFIWSTIPYRMEWRYNLAAHKVIAIDAGHVCQNLYLACEAIGAGTCAIAAYDQSLLDKLLRLNGDDEFSIYLAPVGKIK